MSKNMIAVIIFGLLSLHIPVCRAAVTDTISAGQRLSGNDKLVSSNGRFALGFYQPFSKSSHNASNWYLGIWFNTVPKFTPAWDANGDKPVIGPTSPELMISGDGNLVIIDQISKSIVWSTQANTTTSNNTRATLLNTGNLVLHNSSNSTHILWQSFDYPTDTHLAGAKLGRDKVTGLNRRLVSRKNSIDPASGMYTYELYETNGSAEFRLTALKDPSVPYWSTGEWNGQYFGSIPGMTGRRLINFTLIHNEQEVYFTYTVLDDAMIVRFALNVSGQTKILLWAEPAQEWVTANNPNDQCDVYGICGPFTTCEEDKLSYCSCMKGFSITSPDDWELEDRTGGCTRNTPLDCGSNTSVVAVKRLDGACQGEKQFRAEVRSVGIIQHINLVKLIGFCTEGDKRLIVYEHLPNHSLDAHLFRPDATGLKWSIRYEIALGVARGLAYLHDSCRDCIIHCDIKPENILLNASFIPKIGGLAKFLGRDFSRVLTTMRGTRGYLAPECLSGTLITAKVDVYSYGMVLLEILSGKRNAAECTGTSNDDYVYFPVQVAKKLLEGGVETLVDKNLHGDVHLEQVVRAFKVACWCIQEDEFDRPTMGQVVQYLEGLVEVDIPPVPILLQSLVAKSGSTFDWYLGQASQEA